MRSILLQTQGTRSRCRIRNTCCGYKAKRQIMWISQTPQQHRIHRLFLHDKICIFLRLAEEKYGDSIHHVFSRFNSEGFAWLESLSGVLPCQGKRVYIECRQPGQNGRHTSLISFYSDCSLSNNSNTMAARTARTFCEWKTTETTFTIAPATISTGWLP